MSLAAERRPLAEGEVLRNFLSRTRPLLEEALQDTVDSVPMELGPMAGAAARALGVDGTAGRRWRPYLTLATAEAVGGRVQDAVDVAVAVELTHTASLVLDDMPCMDDSAERRGEPATHALVGSAGAILLAVGFLARAAELLHHVDPAGTSLASFWGRTFGFQGMSGGQAVDLIHRGQCAGELRRLYRRKTTSLAMFAVEAGAVVGGVPATDRSHLRGFGQDLGWAYQLVDDAHDLAEDRSLGRSSFERNPLRHARRLLERGIGRLDAVESLTPDGARLLSAMARDIAGVPPLVAVDPTQEAAAC